MTFSYYEDRPGYIGDPQNHLEFEECIGYIRDYAVSCGLTNLRYGVDEGYFLNGDDGIKTWSRNVGSTYQLSWDARLFKKAIDTNIDWLSKWNWTTGGIDGKDILPHHSIVFYEISNEPIKSNDKDYTIYSPTLTDESGRVLRSMPESGTVNVAQLVKNNSLEAKNAVMLLALYSEDGSLINLEMAENIINPGNTMKFSSHITIPDDEAATLDVMIWSDLDSYRPLSKKYELSR